MPNATATDDIGADIALRGADAIAHALTYPKPVRRLLATLFSSKELTDLRIVQIDPAVAIGDPPTETIFLKCTAGGEATGFTIRYNKMDVKAARASRPNHGDGVNMMGNIAWGALDAPMRSLFQAGYRLHKWSSRFGVHLVFVLGHASAHVSCPPYGIQVDLDQGGRLVDYPAE